MLKKIKHSAQHSLDWYFFGGVIFLVLLGLLAVYDSSSVKALEIYGNQFHFLINQLIWVALGTAGGSVLYLVGYRRLKGLALPFFALSILLLTLVLLPTPVSLEVRGSRSWFAIPLPNSFPVLDEIRFQPSELSKLALVIYLATLLVSSRSDRRQTNPPFRSFFIPTGLVAGLVIAEKDLGSASVIIAIGLACFFFARANLRQIFIALLIFGVGGLALALQSSTFLERWETFLHPDSDPQGAGYQTRQIRITLGSGGLWGVGIGRSLQKYGYIPDVQTDAIFAIVGEEFGFLGASLVVAVFAFLVYRGFRIAERSPDEFGRILVAGITAWVAVQTTLILGGMVGLLPLTGVTLPFVSYGGSSLLALLLAVGILLSVSRKTISLRSAINRHAVVLRSAR
ncbi:MAG: cell cycle protein, cell division protein FtsW [candidate division WWE3 bacterium CSP1-7]|uniref:Probable peptidoglycan glycosyltransferase FtsW n=1 Tax=candidate division WWE3 bacterium CSP1-7 TaxID=1576480 RepID=A0A0T5ZXL6_UNCKA|nr:MAG: cell cycle protein, cell division protein FtsW [candidate division WWE3 bacterium CSP1-7]